MEQFRATEGKCSNEINWNKFKWVNFSVAKLKEEIIRLIIVDSQ